MFLIDHNNSATFMEKYILKRIIFLLAIPLVLLAQDKGPKMIFDHEEANAGEIEQGKIAEHVYPFVNEGTDTLRISNVYSS